MLPPFWVAALGERYRGRNWLYQLSHSDYRRAGLHHQHHDMHTGHRNSRSLAHSELQREAVD